MTWEWRDDGAYSDYPWMNGTTIRLSDLLRLAESAEAEDLEVSIRRGYEPGDEELVVTCVARDSGGSDD